MPRGTGKFNRYEGVGTKVMRGGGKGAREGTEGIGNRECGLLRHVLNITGSALPT